MKSIFFLFIFVLFCSINSYPQLSITLRIVNVPAKHKHEPIYAAGNFNNWVPAFPAGHFSYNTDSALILHLNLPKGKYEYKITRGSWDKVETRSNGDDVSNRVLDLSSDTLIQLNLEEWKDDFASKNIPRKHTASPNVVVIDTAFPIPQLNRTRRIWAYLPADYKASKKKYPVLYMHDGQELFDAATSSFGEWGIDECLDTLFLKGTKECIVIGIDNSSTNRLTEYNPYPFRQYGKPEGNEYVDFIVRNLKPYIDKHYRTLRTKQNTFIAGSSMGGLISLIAVMQYPKVFGGAGIFSPAFWTAPKLIKDLPGKANKLHERLFFYAGGSESDEMVPDMKKIESILKDLSPAVTIEYVDPAGKHNQTAWRKYFPLFINWLLQR